MTCPENELLIRIVYDEAGPAEAEEVRRHLEGCKQCQGEVESIKALDNTLEKLVESETNRHFGAECLDAMTLAAYLDGKLSVEERERAEKHLARCRSCLEELVAAKEVAEKLSSASQSTPSLLLERAVELGVPSRPRRLSVLEHAFKLNHQIQDRIQTWMELLFTPSPRLAWVGIAAGAVLVVAVVLSMPYLPGKKSENPAQKEIPAGPQGFAFGTSEDVITESTVSLSADLKRALLEFEKQPSEKSRAALLNLLKKEPANMPADKVAEIEIEHGLTNDEKSGEEVKEVHVKLFKDGLLVIGEP